MFDYMNKLQSSVLEYFSNIDVDPKKSMYNNYILFTTKPINKLIFNDIVKYEQEIFEKIFSYKVYSVFEMKNPLKIVLKLKRLNMDKLAYLTFEEYLIITTMYKNDDYLQKLYDFYMLTLENDSLLDVLKNIKNIESIPNFVHPFNYVFTATDPDNNVFKIDKLIQISTIIDEHYGNKWTRSYSLVKCSEKIKPVNNAIVRVYGVSKQDTHYWLIKNNEIFFPTTNKNMFEKYINMKTYMFGYSFNYLLNDLELPDTFDLREIVDGLKTIFDKKTKQKYIEVINYLRIIRYYENIEFIFSENKSLSIDKNIVNIQDIENEEYYLITPCSKIKSTHYMEF